MSAGLALQTAMRAALLQHAPLTTLIGGAHIFDELPRGEKPPLVAFTEVETRDWSTTGQKAHEHFITIDVLTNERSRKLAQQVAQEIETRLDMADLTLTGHRLINLRVIFGSITRRKSTDTFGAVLRFRAATEPL